MKTVPYIIAVIQCPVYLGLKKGWYWRGIIAISVNVPQLLLKVKIFQFKNVFNFGNFHGIMNTSGLLQSK